MMAAFAGYGQSQAIVDFKGDDAFSIPMGDSTVLALVGNVFFHHNGAILTCDSAIRYDANYIECFKNVIINKDSTYVYGDRADFNGITNLARVYAPIVKTVDGDVTMYSYDMEFNTLTNIGRYTTGGTITQKDNLMESREAIYHADDRQVYFVGDVAMRNEEYIIQTDSMGYNFDTEVTTFYRPARIWNKDGDFLSANHGGYDRANDTYTFTENSYILTADNQEVFADSITYLKPAQRAYMFNNVQMHDPEQRAYLFGDYGVYWEADQQAIMTDNPSGIGYDEGENPDSVFMRGDTMFMYTFPREELFTAERAARLRLPGREHLDAVQRDLQDSLLVQRPDSLPADSVSTWDHLYGAEADSARLQYGMQGVLPEGENPPDIPPDSLGLPDSFPDPSMPGLTLDSLPNHEGELPPLTSLPPDTPEAGGEESVPEPAAEIVETLPDDTEIAGIAAEEVLPPGEPADSVPKTRRQLRQERRLEQRRAKMQEYAIEQGIALPETAEEAPVDSLEAVQDSLVAYVLQPADSVQQDSLQRVIRSYRNVKVYREDLQAVCDSLVAFSVDSTARMYVKPILWNENNQITADSIYVFSRNEQLDRAEFYGNPIMAQLVLDSLFNQVTGDRIDAFFRNNEIQRMEVLQNAKSYYYMQESGKPDDIGAFLDIKSQDIIFRFDSTRIRQIVPLVDIEAVQYPMHRIPETHTQRFPGFQWMPQFRPMTRYDVCDRVIRPSQRDESRAIPYPQFRITDRMEADKKRYTEDGSWRDRNDTLNIDPAFFINLIR